MALARNASMNRSREQLKAPTESADARRRRNGSSDAFNEAVLNCFRDATRAAVRSHHDAGRSVHGVVDGKVVERKPPKS